MKPVQSVDAALAALHDSIVAEYKERVLRAFEPVFSIPQFINEAPIDPNGPAVIWENRPAKPKRPYRRTSAGRARQVAAMKKFWAAKRKAAKK